MNSLLLFYESLGFLTGFLIGFYSRVLNSKSNRKRLLIKIFIAAGALGVIIILGTVWIFAVNPSGGWAALKDILLGFTLLILPGIGVGMLVDWLVRKITRG